MIRGSVSGSLSASTSLEETVREQVLYHEQRVHSGTAHLNSQTGGYKSHHMRPLTFTLIASQWIFFIHIIIGHFVAKEMSTNEK